MGCSDEEHPTYREMLSWGKFRLSGPVKVLEMPQHFDFPELRRTPAEVRELLSHMGNPDVVAFQTRNPMHRAHEELTKRAAQESGANLLLNPVVGMTKPGDVVHLLGGEGGLPQSNRNRLRFGAAIRRRVGQGVGIQAGAIPCELGVDSRAARLGALGCFQQYGCLLYTSRCV